MLVRAWCLLTALFGMLVCVALGPFLSQTAFAWGDHSLHFMLLSPAVGMLAVTGGETAILKALRRLGALAYVQLFTAIAALFVSVPIYALFGEAGIVPVIVITAFVTMLLTLRRSLQVQPLRLCWEKRLVGEGMGISYNGAYAAPDFSGRRYCEARVWSFFNRFADDFSAYVPYAAGKDADAKEMPLWIIPNKKVSLQDLRDAMRDHYEGTPFALDSDIGGGIYQMPYRPSPLSYKIDGQEYFNERPISTQQTAWSFICPVS